VRKEIPAFAGMTGNLAGMTGWAGCAPHLPVQFKKVFCFFFSKKTRLLPQTCRAGRGVPNAGREQAAACRRIAAMGYWWA
jgi:hypothetical protein